MHRQLIRIACVICVMVGANQVMGQKADPAPAPAQPAARPARPTPPARDPNTAGFVKATELPDGTNPAADADGNFIIGPTHKKAAEMTVKEGVPKGTVHNLTMSSADSKIYPGIARDKGTFGTVDPADPSKLIVTTSRPTPYTRKVAVYVPKQYEAGTAAPFIVGADGPDGSLFVALDNLIAEKRVPVMIAISIGNGSGDAQGSQRGLEYDTMSGLYAEFVESEVLPLVEKECKVKLTKDPEGRATMGCSSGGSCAMIMAWYHPEWYHRVLTYSGTHVNQQWPKNAETPGGAWDFHERLIPNSPVKPLRIWMEVGDKDLLNPNLMRDNMHDWVLANERMAKVLAEKGYHYQFVFAKNAGHCDGGVKQQTLPEALEYVWRGYKGEGK
ncbi:MAG TPA: alpha/beta hydrolase-fold protein [Tepidisphaeraceae bacterium]|nr:alpha/beta hydrolase-fold protein [Tepidisphaeraceae bacterium]